MLSVIHSLLIFSYKLYIIVIDFSHSYEKYFRYLKQFFLAYTVIKWQSQNSKLGPIKFVRVGIHQTHSRKTNQELQLEGYESHQHTQLHCTIAAFILFYYLLFILICIFGGPHQAVLRAYYYLRSGIPPGRDNNNNNAMH